MIKVRAHTCYLGKTGFSAHARGFFRELAKYTDLRVRNYTWDEDISYLTDLDKSIIDLISLTDPDGVPRTYPIKTSFPNQNWTATGPFEQDIDIVLMDLDHHYFYENYSADTKIAYIVWESTELPNHFFKQILTNFDYVWVVTHWHKTQLINQGYPEHRVFVVNEGVDSEFFTETASKLKDYSDNRFKFLFFGRWDYRKAVPEILKSFLAEFDKTEPVDFIISADNPFSVDGMSSTEERLNHYGLNDPRIKIKHFVSRQDYITYIKTGNVLVSCARSEGWNIPLIEAMAAGTPAIYSNWGGQLEFAQGKGIPVAIDTELPASIGADLGFAGATPGLYAEADYKDLSRAMRDAYTNYQSHLEKAKLDSKEIRQNFNWGKVGLDGFSAIQAVCAIELPPVTKKEAVVIMSHADTKERELLLWLNLISLKRQGYPVIISSHIPVAAKFINVADYFIYDKENPVIYEEEHSRFSGTVPVFMMSNQFFQLAYSFDYNHGYAALRLIKNGLGLAKIQGYEYIHFINYDYIIKEPNLLDLHTQRLNECDLFSYTWGENPSTVSTGFFSARANKVEAVVNLINSKETYFRVPNKVVLEDIFYELAVEQDLTIKRDQLSQLRLKNTVDGASSPAFPMLKSKSGQIHALYLAKDNQTGDLLLCACPAPGESLDFSIEYLEINYDYSLGAGKKPVLMLRLSKDILEEGIEVKVKDAGQAIKYDIDTKPAHCGIFVREAIEEFIPVKDTTDRSNAIINYLDGAYVELVGKSKDSFFVEFIDQKDNSVIFSTELKVGSWAKTSRKYYTDWLIRITNLSKQTVEEHKIDLNSKSVLISIESGSLGDTLAWFPHIEEFRKKHNCKVYVSLFKPELYLNQYPEITIVSPGSVLNQVHAVYRLGWYYLENGEIDYNKHPRNMREIPMQATTCDILGLPESQIKPKLNIPNSPRPIEEPYVCIAMHATTQAKYWNNPTGWQEVTDYYLAQGKRVVMLSTEEDGFMGNYYPKGVTLITEPRTLELAINYLKHAELFIGVGSGLSWLSWATGTPTVLISGFSWPMTEPLGENIIRIFRSDVCNGCFNRHKLDGGDWHWCPDHKGTERHYECSRAITASEVILKIEEYFATRDK